MAATDQGPRDVGAVVHAVRILRHLSTAAHPRGVAVIARETGISPSTCFAILRTLVRARLASFDEIAKTYTLGMGVAEIAASLVGIGHAELIRPELEDLARHYGVPVVLWRVTEDNHLVLAHEAHGDAAVRIEMAPGLRLPALIGAAGRCVAAALDLPTTELRRRFARLRWQAPPTFAQYRSEVAAARAKGWAIDEGQIYRGVHSVGSVIVDHDRRPRFALSGVSLAGQHEREMLEQLGAALRDLATTTGAALFPAPRGHADDVA